MKIKALACAVSLAVCFPAFADDSGGKDVAGSQISQQFNITANVNSMLQLTAPDGSALNPDVSMDYSLLKKTLNSTDVQATLATNDNANNIVASLVASPVLLSGSNSIPLKVSMNGKELTTAETLFKSSDLFNGGSAGSIDFNFAPSSTSTTISQGVYKGTVIVQLQQQTPTTTPG